MKCFKNLTLLQLELRMDLQSFKQKIKNKECCKIVHSSNKGDTLL
jgi:hypothetical protein